jgi:hypothetical protein
MGRAKVLPFQIVEWVTYTDAMGGRHVLPNDSKSADATRHEIEQRDQAAVAHVEWCRRQRAAAQAARTTRNADLDAESQDLLTKALEYRARHPGCRRKDIARHLARSRNDAKVRAMAERLKRIELRALKKK